MSGYSSNEHGHGSPGPAVHHAEGHTGIRQTIPCAVIVANIRADRSDGMQELYNTFSRGVRMYFARALDGQDVDDKVHDLFLTVVAAIKDGSLHNPECLMGFVRTIARRMVAGHIDQIVQRRRNNLSVEYDLPVLSPDNTPEDKTVDRERVEIMLAVLRSMSERDRDILTRFYLYEQPAEVICSEMDLTPTQFRLLKSRAKARFAQLGKKQLRKTPLRSSPAISH